MKKPDKIYIDNSRFMEFISEMATQLTEMKYGADTFIYSDTDPLFSEEAQDFYNETYDEFEGMANRIMGVYMFKFFKTFRDNEKENEE